MTGVAKNQRCSTWVEDVLEVAEVHGQRGEEEREAEGEDELHQHRQGQQERGPGELALPGEEHEQDGQPEQEVDEVREDGDGGQHLGREEHLLDQVAARDDDAGRLGERGGEPGPGQDAAEEEQEVGLDVRLPVRQDHGEDERVGEEDEQRVDEAPEEAEHAAAVAGLELAGDEALRRGPGSGRASGSPRSCAAVRSRLRTPRSLRATASRVTART